MVQHVTSPRMYGHPPQPRTLSLVVLQPASLHAMKSSFISHSQYYNVTPPSCLSSTVGTSDIQFSVGVVQIECGLPLIVHRMGSFRTTVRSLPGKAEPAPVSKQVPDSRRPTETTHGFQPIVWSVTLLVL